MIANTEAPRQLHPELIGFNAQQVIKVARKYQALGWKVNGAGGNGGSITILCKDIVEIRDNMIREITSLNAGYDSIPITISRSGLCIKITRITSNSSG
jgi:D-glycero-alpha-D-manno-heptose-7-phosphate kinase